MMSRGVAVEGATELSVTNAADTYNALTVGSQVTPAPSAQTSPDHAARSHPRSLEEASFCESSVLLTSLPYHDGVSRIVRWGLHA